MNDNPKRILLVGDWHGNIAFADQAFRRAQERNCDVMFQLGDFGYWEHTDRGVRFMDGLAALVQQYGVPLYWLDGNHDNHPLLWERYSPFPADAPISVRNSMFWPIRDGIEYAPRGHRWTWHGVRFMAFGGAASIDRNWRRPGESWWTTEIPDKEEVEYAMRFDGGPHLDVMLTHESPIIPPIMEHIGFNPDRESEQVRNDIRRIVEAVSPRRLYHGHWHVPQEYTLEYNGGFFTRIRGLDADVNYDIDSATQMIGLSDGRVHEN